MNNALDHVFFALSDSTRREIVGRLARRSETVGSLSAPFRISAPAISRHLKVLERAGLITRRVVGRQHHCALVPSALQNAEDWLSFHRDFWESRLNELSAFLERQKA